MNENMAVITIAEIIHIPKIIKKFEGVKILDKTVTSISCPSLAEQDSFRQENQNQFYEYKVQHCCQYD